MAKKLQEIKEKSKDNVKKQIAKAEKKVKVIQGAEQELVDLKNVANVKLDSMREGYDEIFKLIQKLNYNFTLLPRAIKLRKEDPSLSLNTINNYNCKIVNLENKINNIGNLGVQLLAILKQDETGGIAVCQDLDKWLTQFRLAEETHPNEISSRLEKCLASGKKVADRMQQTYSDFFKLHQWIKVEIAIVDQEIVACEGKFNKILEKNKRLAGNEITEFLQTANIKLAKMNFCYERLSESILNIEEKANRLPKTKELTENINLSQIIVDQYQHQIDNLKNNLGITKSFILKLFNILSDSEDGVKNIYFQLEESSKVFFAKDNTAEQRKHCKDNAFKIFNAIDQKSKDFKEIYKNVASRFITIDLEISFCRKSFEQILEIAKSINVDNSDNNMSLFEIKKLADQNKALVIQNCKMNDKIEELINILQDKSFADKNNREQIKNIAKITVS